MKQMLEEVKSIPGVIGGYALHPKKGILANCLPAMFKPDKLLEVSRQLMKIYGASRMNSRGMQDISLHFDGSVVMLRRFSDLLFVVLICEPGVNISMVNMSMSLAVEELRDRMERDAPAEMEETAAGSPDSIRTSGPLAAPLKKLEEALAATMGPMAEMIMDEAIEEWFDSTKVSFQTLPALVRILCREIGDAQRVQQFQNQIGPYGQI